MKRTFGLVTVLAATLCLLSSDFVGSVQAYPQPQIVSRSWQLDFDFQTPKPIAVEDAFGNVKWYWYMLYSVENNSAKKRFLSPEVTVATDSGKIITAGRNVPSNVFNAVQAAEGNPYLIDPLLVVDELLVGSDYSKETVAIWPAFDHDVDEMRVFVAGLSGESAYAENALTKERVLLRRVKMLTFSTPGNLVGNIKNQPVVLQADAEVMR
ncbi:hypothetical protein KS4_01920 [Poriferisphaera corsica]|uniref:Uncharacterized protein n=1 Tax=Poriferisphaera corsica TaxID=2528020 RepID=A0A517YPL8_9BACT|nr:hypothetical protein [Poriferisphaera corsica]QDU32163.1 hypothetical protein KS4_01920 [Poriferisphaera corsica]